MQCGHVPLCCIDNHLAGYLWRLLWHCCDINTIRHSCYQRHSNTSMLHNIIISFPCFTCMVISNQLLHHCDHMILVLGRKVYSWNIVLPLATSLSQVLGKGKRLGERPLLNMPPWKRARNVSNVQSLVMSSAKLLYLCNCIFHFLLTYFLYLCRIQVFGKISSSRQTKDYG